ncbi:hypothetical protein [Streptomyces sp. CBG31]|uniref:hypothetical protein n=1 Tax=Streptomyces sp. CBG31 TaxID=2762623 RepID=UPI0021BD47BC|nr:hypothetical protein [Streptomyces sp. CBG31]
MTTEDPAATVHWASGISYTPSSSAERVGALLPPVLYAATTDLALMLARRTTRSTRATVPALGVTAMFLTASLR